MAIHSSGQTNCALKLKVMEGVEGEVVVGKDEVSEGYEEMCSKGGGGRVS